MAHSGGVITYSVNMPSDINDVMGTAHTDLYAFCTDSHLNKWARFKPVVYAMIDTTGQLDSNYNWKVDAVWWRGTSGNCGITYTSFSTVAAARAAIASSMNIWGYTKPFGGAASPYRLIDFNQYSHYAPPPTSQAGANDAQLTAGAELTIMVATSIDDGLSLKLNNIGSFDNYYYLAAVYDGSGNLMFLHTSTKKVGEYADGETIEIVVPYNNGSYGYQGKLVENNTYYAFLMLSSLPYTCAQVAQNGVYVPLPTTGGDNGLSPASFRCLRSSMYATVNAYTIGSGRIVNWEINLYGGGNPSAVTIQLIYASTGQVVSGQQKTIDFSDGSEAITGGYKRVSRFSEVLTCPDANIDNYRFEFIYSSIDVKAIIGHDLQPIE